MKLHRKLAVGIAVAGAIAAGALMAQATVGPKDVAFPTGFEKWEMYQQLNRHDVKQYRELYAKPEIVKAVREGKPIPNGTVLAIAIFAAQEGADGKPTRDAKGNFIKGKPMGVTVMEKRAGLHARWQAQRKSQRRHQGVLRVPSAARETGFRDFAGGTGGHGGGCRPTSVWARIGGDCRIFIRPGKSFCQSRPDDHLDQHRRFAASGDGAGRHHAAHAGGAQRPKHRAAI